ncbi:MAG: hypothetical protein ACT4OO_05520, partial [Nitrospiraceae bacterium]
DTQAGAGARADQAVVAIGERLEWAAEGMQDRFSHEGKIGDAIGRMTKGVRASGHYLQEQGMTGTIEDLEALIRRYPLHTMLVGIGLGYLCSHLKSR